MAFSQAREENHNLSGTSDLDLHFRGVQPYTVVRTGVFLQYSLSFSRVGLSEAALPLALRETLSFFGGVWCWNPILSPGILVGEGEEVGAY